MKYLKFILAGIAFGMILVKSEVLSWYRIQEMFRFQSFHMYGIFASAIAVGVLSVFLLKRFKIKAISGEPIATVPKKFHWGNVIGALLFGVGWAMTGACPGPMYALLGSGITVFALAILSAILGVYVYGLIRDKLPH